MPQLVTLLLSEAGSQVLGRGIFKFASPAKRVAGTLLSCEPEGVCFQDRRLLRDNKMVLVKWNFIDVILSEISPPEPDAKRVLGFGGQGTSEVGIFRSME